MNANNNGAHSIVLSKLFHLKQILFNFYEMQMQGALMMPQKVSYAISRNYAYCISHNNHYVEFKRKLKEECVSLTDDGKDFARTEDKKDWIFKSAVLESKFKIDIDEYLNKEVPWQPYKVYEKELETVTNLPVTAFADLQEFGIITEVEIISTTLRKA